MGAERWLQFKSVKEADRVREFLSSLEGEISSEKHSCGVRWTAPCKLELSYSFGGDCDDEFATFVCRELARRFHVIRIGADSVGWYTDDDWLSDNPKGAPGRYGPYKKWKDWIKDYKPEWAYELRYEPSLIGLVLEIESEAVSVFENLEVPK